MHVETSLPFPLVKHLCDALGNRDDARVDRVLRQAERAGPALVPELDETVEAAARLPEEEARVVRGAVWTLVAATDSSEARAASLRWAACGDP